MISLTINGRKIEVEGPIKVLEAALQNNIHIPTMCYYPKIESFGGCRMCLVRVDGKHRLQASCSLDAEDGMVVETETPEIHAVRKAMLEFMLINHPLDCPSCDKAGECDLQDFSVLYGAAEGRFLERKRTDPESKKDPLIVRNMERCIMCTKCTRVCAELQGASAIDVIGRGKHTSIEPFSGEKFDCEYCGACIIACPVGSLMSKLHRHNYRPWDTEEQFDSTCTYCGVGCGVHLELREGALQRLIPAESDVNQGLLCARGFFGYEYISSPDRLTSPLLRKNGELTPVSWEEALEYVASRLREIRDDSGGRSLAALASPKCTIEDNYLLQKLMRAGLGSNNIDSSARMGMAGLRRIVDGLLGHARTISYVKDMAASGSVLCVCSDPVAEAPVLGVRVRNAHDAGAKVITLGHAPGLRRHRSISLHPRLKDQWHVLGAILSAVLEIRKPPFNSDKNDRMDDVLNSLALPSPADMDGAIPEAEIRRVARALVSTENVSLVAGRELACSHAGPWSIIVFAALAYVLDASVYMISEGANENGLLDMGCEPDTLPGPAPLADTVKREMLEGIWGGRLPDKKGLSLMEIFEAAALGEVKGLYVMGANPASSLPDSGFVTDALAKLDLLVVQDIFMSDTARLAHVVLPVLTWAERKGTYVNMERRLLAIGRGVKADGMEDWRILSALCKAFGLESGYERSDDVLSEIMKISPYYCKLYISNIRGETCKWPEDADDPRNEMLDREALKAFLEMPAANDHADLDFALETPLFLSGTTALHSDALLRISPEPSAKMNTALADIYKIRPDDTLRFFSERGEVEIKAVIDPYLADNTVYFTNTQESTGIMKHFRYNKMPFTNTPCKYTQNSGLRRGD